MQLLSEWKLNDQEQEWKNDAACKGVERSVFFPTIGYNQHSKHAIKICKTCPVKKRCAEFAINNNISNGIWGGLNPNQRQQLKRSKL
jgi:WhiB family redox-sensing transcriptional regulator